MQRYNYKKQADYAIVYDSKKYTIDFNVLVTVEDEFHDINVSMIKG